MTSDVTAEADGRATSIVEAGTPRSRAAARRAALRAETGMAEARHPLRRRILEALASGPAIPTDLATRLEVDPATISRQMKLLRGDGLARDRPVFGDARKREYVLTLEGEVQLGRHLTFGAPSAEPPPPAPTPQQTLDLLDGALANALVIRRGTNDLAAAADRLRVVLSVAQKANAYSHVVEATAELATTLRQNRERAQVTSLLDALERIALGQQKDMPASLALPAAAHRAYGLGRLGEEHDGDLVGRAKHLDTAAQHFAELAVSPSYGSTASWGRRQAWSQVSLANNFRQQSDLEDAMVSSGGALVLFEDLDDAYGRSRCLFMFGFCLRLLGDFDTAWSFLEASHELAYSNRFERFQADSLMQMGEVRRCQGHVGEARELLAESLVRAERMSLFVTQAFAQSALGAVEYQEHRVPEAREGLAAAHLLFETCGHREGLALNARRQAAAARGAIDVNSGGALTSAKDFIAEALAGYVQLRSPAGITACLVERGRLLMVRGESLASAVTPLHNLLDDTKHRLLLELDPWVPHVLESFAADAEDRGLRSRAGALLTAAQRRLEERARRYVDGVTNVVGEVRRQVSDHTIAAAFAVNEMGGEARRDRGAEPLLHPA